MHSRLPKPAWSAPCGCATSFPVPRAGPSAAAVQPWPSPAGSPRQLELLDFALSLSVHPPEKRTLANGYRARFFLFEGKAASAARTLKEAALGMRTDPGYGSWCLALLAEAEALLGHSAAAEEARSEALSLHGNDRLSVFVDERRALAWVDAQAGRLTEAIEQLWAAADMALERGQRTFELIILGDLLRLGEAAAAARARDVSTLVEGLLGKAIGLHAQAVISGRGADLELAASAFAPMGFSLTASELWAEASAAYRREGLQARSTKAAKKISRNGGLMRGDQNAASLPGGPGRTSQPKTARSGPPGSAGSEQRRDRQGALALGEDG